MLGPLNASSCLLICSNTDVKRVRGVTEFVIMKEMRLCKAWLDCNDLDHGVKLQDGNGWRLMDQQSQ